MTKSLYELEYALATYWSHYRHCAFCITHTSHYEGWDLMHQVIGTIKTLEWILDKPKTDFDKDKPVDEIKPSYELYKPLDEFK